LRIVLNADDFGAAADTIEATIECFEAGALTSATFMPGAPFFERAISYARQRSGTSFGVHLTFVGDGTERPLSPPDRIPSLTSPDGLLLPTQVIRRRAMLGRIPIAEIAREIEAQLGFVRRHGIPITHVDSHRHVHKLGPFREALRQVLPRFGISRVRNVQDVWLARPVRSATYWFGAQWRRELMQAFVSTEHFYMPASRRETNWEQPLLERIQSLPGSVLEVGVHPGVDERWRRDERESVRRFAIAARERGHELIPWSAVD
jgi:predicted glycoside hydrolase/deacetylase ChbG (UPF0249 family)